MRVLGVCLVCVVVASGAMAQPSGNTPPLGSGSGTSDAVPTVRLGFSLAPEAFRLPLASEPLRAAYSLSVGPATGFREGALHAELRASLPLGTPALSAETTLAWTDAVGYDTVVLCAPEVECPPSRSGGADAVSLGVGLSGHTGRFRAEGLRFRGAHMGLSVHLVNPTAADANQLRVSLTTGLSVPLARGVALGAEVQASAYTTEDPDRDVHSLTPMLRLAIDG